MIIDFHTHVFPERIVKSRDNYLTSEPVFGLLYSDPRAKMVSSNELISSMDDGGISISVIQNIQWSSLALCVESNNYILESAARYPGRLVSFCAIPFTSSGAAVEEIERCARGGARGIGELRPSQKSLEDKSFWEPVTKALIRTRLVLLTHSSEPVGHAYSGKGDLTPGVLYNFIRRYPELTVVLAHWGGGLPFYALMPEVKRALKNVWFDTAASPFLYLPQIYSHVAQITGEDRILFGSDYPLLHHSRAVNEIRGLDMPEESRNLILAGNACRILGVQDGG
jgi:uncharacterized protein